MRFFNVKAGADPSPLASPNKYSIYVIFLFPPFLNFYLYKTLITLNKLNALIHIARLIDNPDTFADNLRTSIFRLKLKQTKQPCPVRENRFCDVMVQGMSSDAWDEFSKTILERCLIISLWNPLLGSLCVIKKDLCIPCGGLFRLSTCPSTCSRSLFFTAAHFQLALVAASICHFVTAATKFSCCSVPTKNVSFVFLFVCLFFFISRSRSLSPFFSLSFAGLSPTFSFSPSFSCSIFQICGHYN